MFWNTFIICINPESLLSDADSNTWTLYEVNMLWPLSYVFDRRVDNVFLYSYLLFILFYFYSLLLLISYCFPFVTPYLCGKRDKKIKKKRKCFLKMKEITSFLFLFIALLLKFEKGCSSSSRSFFLLFRLTI